MMYKFTIPIGTKIKTNNSSGSDSNKTGKVCEHFKGGFDWSKLVNYIPIEFDDGIKRYIPENHLHIN